MSEIDVGSGEPAGEDVPEGDRLEEGPAVFEHERLWPALRPTLSDYGGWALLRAGSGLNIVDRYDAQLVAVR